MALTAPSPLPPAPSLLPPQGVAFKDFLEGTYHPAASLYTLPEQAEGATVAFNFGPDFAHAPPVPDGCAAARPMCEMATAAAVVAPGAGPGAVEQAAGAGSASAAAAGAALDAMQS